MFQRHPLRDEVQKEIRARLDDGRLAANSRINETHLSTDLGISRTPLREALLQLETAGFLASDMGRGFLVPALEVDEFSNIQAVLARMEPLALSAAMPYPSQRIMELNNLLVRSKMHLNGTGPTMATPLTNLISRWAGLLMEGCPNGILRSDTLRLEALSRRYWFAAAVGGFPPLAMIDSLEALYEMVRTGQSARAASHWSEHILKFSHEAARHLATIETHASES